ncbi:hypothetical protein ACEZ3G_02295 [Maribacter algicola]|uniref:Uncharacterized protein n=1 Tax=Meishania litoralis TaxID=3434685 RepID=A0ACC7LL35_9FLAO
MKWPVRIFNFYLDASIHVALAVFALVQITGGVLKFETSAHLSYFLFFGTIACYNFIKYGVGSKKYILVSNRYHKNIQIASFVALIPALYHACFFTYETWLGVIVIIVFTGLYALPIMPHGKNLRSRGLLKIFLVGLVWSLTTVALPAIQANKIMNWDVLIELIQRFLLVLVLMIPFEIRDLKYDKLDLDTLPQRVGIMNTKKIGYIVTLVLYIMTFLKDELAWSEILGKAILGVMLCLALIYVKKDRSKYFASFWVEAIPIFWWAVIFSLQYYF